MSVVVESRDNAFTDNTDNMILKDVSVDSRMKLLYFHMDYRPPYW